MKRIVLFVSLVLVLASSCFSFAQKQGALLIDSLQTVVAKTKQDSNRVIIYNKIALANYGISVDEGVKYADLAMELSRKLNYKRGLATAFNNIGIIYNYRYVYDSGMMALDKARAIATEIDDKILLAKIFTNKGLNAMHSGNNDEALRCYQEAIRNSELMNDKKGLAGQYNNMGLLYENLGRLSEALKYHLLSLKMNEELGLQQGIANSYNNIGSIYMYMANYTEALKNHNASLKISEALGNKKITASATTNVGLDYYNLGNYDEALRYFSIAEQTRKDLGDKKGLAEIYNSVGAIYFARGQHKLALETFLSAFELFKGLGLHDDMATAGDNLGCCYFKLGNTAEAEKYLLQAISLAKETGLKRQMSTSCFNISELYTNKGDYKKALEYFKLYTIAKDSMFNQENLKKTVQLQMQYDFDKKEALAKLTQEQAMTQQKNRYLWATLGLLLVVFAAIIALVQANSKNKIQKQVEIAKRKFFDNVVHEVRTPLSMIQGPIKVLQSKIFEPELNYQLSIAERNAGRLNELITQMLSISKIDAATYQLNESYGNLDVYLSDLTTQFAEQAKQNGLNFSTQIDCVSDLVLFDKDALDKILGNLLSNALKYTASGGSVGIDASCTPGPDGIGVKISVWDNGIGISKNDQSKIFDRFYRSSDQQRSNIKGVGIGLSLAMELVKLMNGTIDVVSEPGNGSVFTVTLPLKLKPAFNNSEAPAAIDKCILLVEDDADILEFNLRLLQEQGYEVVTAINGEEALKVVAQKLPDLIITDLMMPVKDGFALLAEIRADAITKEIPVVILSSKSAAGSRITAIEGGAQVYLPKPFLPEELIATVKSQMLVSHRKVEAEPVASEVKLSLEEQMQKADPFAKKCYAIVQEHINDSELTVEFLADMMHVNRSHFQRKLKASAGFSPNELIRAVRLEKARAMLLAREGNISEIAYSTGFTSPSYFGKCYTDYFGHPPSKDVA